MPEETPVAAAPSAVEAPVMDVSRGPLVDITPEQRAEFRKTGNLPEPPKKEAAAASSESKPVEGEAKPAGDSETPESKQEKPKEPKPKQTAEERIAQLEATIEKIRKGKGIETPKAESSPAKPEPVREHPPTRPKPTAEDKKEDGTPKFETYEDFVEDLSDWKSEQREVKNQREQREQAQANAFKGKVEAARSRYENFDDVKDSFLASVSDPGVNSVVRDMLNDSDVLPDLVFTIGSSKDDLAIFVKMAKENPGKALRYIALTESLIAEELEGKAKPKVEPEPPAKPITAAPKPPSEVGGRAASPGDELASAAKAGDFRSFKAEANAPSTG
jgi:hypothetical protein